MDCPIVVQYAVACLEGLEQPATAGELSRRQGIPMEECQFVLNRFEAAGIVRKDERGLFERSRPLDEFTSLEVLEAIWARPEPPSFRMLYGQEVRGTALHTRHAAVNAAWARG